MWGSYDEAKGEGVQLRLAAGLFADGFICAAWNIAGAGSAAQGCARWLVRGYL